MFPKLTALFMAIALPMLAVESIDSFDLSTNTTADCRTVRPQKCNDRQDCERGRRGRRGPQGPAGATGLNGATGATGAAGISNGSLIPFASGDAILFSAQGVAGTTGAAISFGNGASNIFPITPALDNTSLPNEAFSVAGDLVITDIAAFFSPAEDIPGNLNPVQITAQIYISTVPNNIFTPLAGATVNLPLIGVALPAGIPISASVTGLSIFVPANSRLLYVFYATTENAGDAVAILGFASGGIRHL